MTRLTNEAVDADSSRSFSWSARGMIGPVGVWSLLRRIAAVATAVIVFAAPLIGPAFPLGTVKQNSTPSPSSWCLFPESFGLAIATALAPTPLEPICERRGHKRSMPSNTCHSATTFVSATTAAAATAAAAVSSFGSAPCHYIRSDSSRTCSLFARKYRNDRYGREGTGDASSFSSSSSTTAIKKKRQVGTDRPTETLMSRPSAPSAPSRPKVVVLGATGRIGRLVVKHLLGSGADITVVAFVRSRRKAFDVLLDELDDDGTLVRRNRRRGPTLEVVVGDLVSREELYGYNHDDYDDDDDEYVVDDDDLDDAKQFQARLDSIRRFYGNETAEEVRSYSREYRFDPDEALVDAMKGCTAIVSCVGTVRPTNVWSDYVKAPWRIFMRDASRWCRDARHPYYVNYLTTRKLLDLAEREQRKREAEWDEYERFQEEMEKDALKMGLVHEREDGDDADDRGGNDRIKIVRISDLAVTAKPWGLVPVVTNIGRSLVFRYQDEAERILEESEVVDTIILRPGDLVDEERNETTTSIQVDSTGVLPYPAIVSRDDVAAVAAAAALTRSDGTHPALYENRYFRVVVGGKVIKKKRRKISHLMNNDDDDDDPIGKAAGKGGGGNGRRDERKKMRRNKKATSRTWAIRWAGEHLEQGRRRDGLPDAQSCVDRCTEEEARRAKKRRRMEKMREADPIWGALDRATRMLWGSRTRRKKRRPKPYGVFVALPVYAAMAAVAAAALHVAPGREVVADFVAGRLTGIVKAAMWFLPK